MESQNVLANGNLVEHQPSLGVLQAGLLPISQFSVEGANIGKKANNMSWKLSSPVLSYDPSYSGELDPYTVIILSQL
jgi:hypothetical protein